MYMYFLFKLLICRYILISCFKIVLKKSIMHRNLINIYFFIIEDISFLSNKKIKNILQYHLTRYYT